MESSSAIGATSSGKLVPVSERQLNKTREHIGIVFQQFNLFPHMTALQNVIEAPIRVSGVPKARPSSAAAPCSRKVGLSDKREFLSLAAFRRPAAAGRDCALAGHGAQGDAVRRGDIGARPRAGRRGPCRDAGLSQETA